MDKLITFIISLFGIRSKTSRELFTGLLGVVMTVFLIGFSQYVIITMTRVNSDFSSDYIEKLTLVLIIPEIIIIFYTVYYIIKYAFLAIITLIRYGFSPNSKDSGSSIEALMTSAIEDKGRMRREIVKYLKESSSPKNFAALHIWLCERQLLYPTDNKSFLNSLSVDFSNAPSKENEKESVHVPSASSFILLIF